MRKFFSAIVVIVLLAANVQAQNSFPSTGNAGVGAGSNITTLPDPFTITSTLPANIGSLRSFGGGNLTSGTTAGGIYFGSYDPSVLTRYAGALISIKATENWTAGTAHGTALTFGTAANGTTTIAERLRIDNNGFVGIGTGAPASLLHVYQPTALGTAAGNLSNIYTYGGAVGSGKFMNKLWIVRDAAGTDWTTARFHDAISVDASYATPGVDTKTWWERDPYNNIQSWGNAANTYMTINAGNVGIGAATPSEPLTIASSNAFTMSLLRNATGGNITSGTTGGAFILVHTTHRQQRGMLEQ